MLNDQAETKQVIVAAGGESLAEAVVHSDAGEAVRAVAGQLAHYIGKATGAALRIVATKHPGQGSDGGQVPVIPIYVGVPSLLSPELILQLQQMDEEGFIIEVRPERIVIGGRTTIGTEHGVYEFLERYVGVRWLMPGPAGEDVPLTDCLSVPVGIVTDNPSFMARILSPLMSSERAAGFTQYEWARRNRIVQRFDFHHNMYRLFPPGKYGKTNPEFFPMRGGERYIPADDSIDVWQPSFSDPATVHEAIRNIIRYFDEHPEQTSYALGVNDSGGFCEEEPDHPLYTSRRNSKGFIDMSDIYYNWVNQVAEGVSEVYPDKWFGLLAYENVIDPPSFPLHPRVVPVLTKDRMSWLDAEVKDAGAVWMDRWKEAADRIGWYDYIYGNPYYVPRMYTRLMADNYRLAEQLGVSAHYAEIYPNWGEGPKAWLCAKLQWNPKQDVDALLEEWYVRAVGKQAAPDLAAYYELWERFWTVRVPQSEWFARSKNKIYLHFFDPDYVSLITDEDIAESRKLLESVVAKAAEPLQCERAELLMKAFDYYEASVLSYPRPVVPITGAEQALAIVNDGHILSRLELAAKRYALLDEYSNHPVLLQHNDSRKLEPFGLLWSGWNADEFWKLADYLRMHEPAGGPVHERICDLSRRNGEMSDDTTSMRMYAQLLLGTLNADRGHDLPADGTDGGRSADPAVDEIGGDGLATGCASDGGASSDNPTRSIRFLAGRPYEAHTLHRSFPAKPGLFAVRCVCRTLLQAQQGTAIQLGLRLLDGQENTLITLRSAKAPLAHAFERPVSLEWLEEIPDSYKSDRVKEAQFVAYADNLPIDAELELDNIEWYYAPHSFRSGRM